MTITILFCSQQEDHLAEDDLHYTIANTCPVDSIVQILIFAHTYNGPDMDDFYENFSQICPVFGICREIYRNGLSEQVYQARFDMLFNMSNVYLNLFDKRPNLMRRNTFILDCWSDPGELLDRLINDYASYTVETEGCEQCHLPRSSDDFESLYINADVLHNVQLYRHCIADFEEQIRTQIAICRNCGRDLQKNLQDTGIYIILENLRHSANESNTIF